MESGLGTGRRTGSAPVSMVWVAWPTFRDIAQGQVHKLGGGVVAGEMAPVFDDLAQAHVQAFDGVDCSNLYDDGQFVEIVLAVRALQFLQLGVLDNKLEPML